MAWEERGGRRYYYRKVWKDGRCFSVYEGGGLVGERAAERVEDERDAQARRRGAERDALAAFDAVDGAIQCQWAAIREAVAAELESAGYHRHKRQWRRRRA
jgi:hypothetical protein